MANQGYGVRKSRQESIDNHLYDVVEFPAPAEAAQVELKNTSSCKVHLIIGIALSTAVLALVVAMVSVGLSTAFNSKLEIQSLATVVNDLQLTLNQSVKTIEDLGQWISALQTDAATQYGTLNQLQQQVASQTQLTSCSEIPTDRPSGEYWILSNSSSVRVYCEMNRTCCHTNGRWMRVANLDMTDPNQQCPDGFLLNHETTAPLRTCGRHGQVGCVSTTFPVHGIEYSRVCGRVIGYQFGSPEAFDPYNINSNLTINDAYVEGVSLTHGQLPRKHIWTFACAVDEVDIRGSLTCPCTRSNINNPGVVPPFIGQDYFCDTGSRGNFQSIFYPDDPLWNGQGCGGSSTCCSFNNPPWFCKQLPLSTTDDVELRLCFNQKISNEDIFLELVDIFVQ